MIKIENLYKSYNGNNVLNGLSIELEENSDGLIYGFLGKNGAGKTTTMNILNGLAKFDSGECVVNGVRLNPKKRVVLNSVGFLPESPSVYEYLSATEYLSFLGSINKDAGSKSVDELLELTGLYSVKDKKIGGFSRGMSQRLGIASALINDPSLIFLDEPTSALDPEGRYMILELLQKLKNDGKTIFLSTHLLDDVERVCDKVGILDKGKLVIEGNMDQLLNETVGIIYDLKIENHNNLVNLKNDLENYDFIRLANKSNDYLQIHLDNDHDKNKLLQILIDKNVNLISFNLHKTKLEDIFLSLYKEN